LVLASFWGLPSPETQKDTGCLRLGRRNQWYFTQQTATIWTRLYEQLLGVLLRFRQNPTAFMADIEQMFHSFVVKENIAIFYDFCGTRGTTQMGKL
jgi:hypothetical protein